MTTGEGKCIDDVSEINAIGHRVVHGGEKFKASCLITDEVINTIRELSPLAPLHNPAGILGIEAARKVFGPDIPMVAVFDTAFHSTMPPKAYMYAIPYEYYEKYGVRRYGFHGTSHKYVAYKAAEYLEEPIERLKLITCHLGNGSSIAAVDQGKVIDTSMGMTPLAGLMMGTRCGDIDPSVVNYLKYNLNITGHLFDIFNMLKKEAHTAPKQVTRDTIIGDILDMDQTTAPYFMEIGMHCLGCPASRGETIEEACEVHGVNCDELLEKLNTHLAAKKA